MEIRATLRALLDSVQEVGAVLESPADYVDDAQMASFVPTVVPLCSVMTLQYLKAHNYVVVATVAAPTVVSVYPADADEDVDVSVAIVVTFSEPMNAASVAAGIKLMDGQVEVGISVAMDMAKTVATVTPDDPLDLATTFKVVVTTGAEDVSGAAIASQYAQSSGFTTVAS
jgi:hypothetical protein